MRNRDVYNDMLEIAERSGLSRHDADAFYAAYEEAITSPFSEFALGCVIVANGRILARGTNAIKSDPMQKRYNLLYRNFAAAPYCCREHSLHAETAALKSVPYPVAQKIDWSKCEVYIYRLAPGLPFGQGLAAPCPACAHALADYGVRKVFFTDNGLFRKGLITPNGKLVSA